MDDKVIMEQFQLLMGAMEKMSANMATKEDLAKLESRMDSMESKIETMDSRIDRMDSRMDSMESRMATKEDLAELESRMASKQDLEELKIDQGVKAVARDAAEQAFAMIEDRVDRIVSEKLEEITDRAAGKAAAMMERKYGKQIEAIADEQKVQNERLDRLEHPA